MIKAVFLDMGETLVYNDNFRDKLTDRLWRISNRYVNVDRGRVEELLREWDNIPWREGLEEYWDLFRCMIFVRKLGLTPRPDLVEEFYREVRDAYVEGYKFTAEANNVVRALRDRGLSIGIISNAGDYRITEERLREAGLIDYIDIIVASQGVVWKKPSSKIFQIALYLLGIEAHEAIHVGDNPEADIRGAKEAGLWAIQVLNDMNDPSPLADAYIRRLGELPDAVDKIVSRVAGYEGGL